MLHHYATRAALTVLRRRLRLAHREHAELTRLIAALGQELSIAARHRRIREGELAELRGRLTRMRAERDALGRLVGVRYPAPPPWDVEQPPAGEEPAI